ncbi:hypothetical protein [Ascidiimonas sp. W6]|uniref:hypothetical protein n=1 Tax=Ascidiimonas meishanensis TaxID=3128903 RepID=UPI0030EEF6E8
MKPINTSEASRVNINKNIAYLYNDIPYKNNSFSITLSKLFAEWHSILKHILKTVKKENSTAYWIALITCALSIVCILGLVIDKRMLLGVNVWIKPLKFTISIAIYIITTSFLLSIYPYSKRKKGIINGIVSWSLLIELGIIICQAARGVQSHYNVSTGFDAILYMSMGLLTGINVFIIIVLMIDSLRLKLKTKKSIQWSIFLGLTIIFFSSWIGGQMISQLSHSVGVADGGAGLPLVNWSTVAGDLRIAHFFGLHGIQIIPLFAFWLSKKSNTSSRNQIIAVTVFSLLYAAWIGFVYYQAKQGIPLLAI